MRFLIAAILSSLGVLFSAPSYAPFAPCLTCSDTLPAALDSILTSRMDSAVKATKTQLDSLSVLKDSVAVELKSVLRERKKKIVSGGIIGWPTDIVKTSDGKIQYWSWYFYQYPDGEYKFYKLVIR